MKSIARQLAFYEAYHQNFWNKATHFAGIPAIIYAIFIPLSWPHAPWGNMPITAAMLFAAAVLMYYLLLDWSLAVAMAVAVGPLLYAAHRTAQVSWSFGAAMFVVFFVGGWILQLIGHSVFEKRRPAFTDNLIQLLIGPLYFAAELFFLAGLKQDLRAEMRRSSAAGKTA